MCTASKAISLKEMQWILELPSKYMLCAGEFGTTFTTNDDKAWLHDFSEWKNNIAPANDGLHDNVNSYFYWYCRTFFAFLVNPMCCSYDGCWLGIFQARQHCMRCTC